ncbi:hypothetical protein O181_016357 [Austropuccinia psidii MF-1]|uniref:Uncharacterized protein n=1 Tax=Austropuccinia psidii MF-1 TaxID=1389203 RepID=A0A9Q3C5G6_9BASI|nr:hypothetical protein [Austropuccinia psidii MF-1]
MSNFPNSNPIKFKTNFEINPIKISSNSSNSSSNPQSQPSQPSQQQSKFRSHSNSSNSSNFKPKILKNDLNNLSKSNLIRVNSNPSTNQISFLTNHSKPLKVQNHQSISSQNYQKTCQNYLKSSQNHQKSPQNHSNNLLLSPSLSKKSRSKSESSSLISSNSSSLISSSKSSLQTFQSNQTYSNLHSISKLKNSINSKSSNQSNLILNHHSNPPNLKDRLQPSQNSFPLNQLLESHQNSSDNNNDSSSADEARVNRKILDLEISNASLLAINKSLELTKAKQSNEIRELKKILKDQNLHQNLKFDDLLLDHDLDSNSSNSNSDSHQSSLTLEVLKNQDEKFNDLMNSIESLIFIGNRAIQSKPDSNLQRGQKVLNPIQIEIENNLISNSINLQSQSLSLSNHPHSIHPNLNSNPHPHPSINSSLSTLPTSNQNHLPPQNQVNQTT